VKKLIFRSLFTLAHLILLDLGGFVPRAPVCSGLHSSPSVQESSRFSSWLRFCGEASLRVDFLVSYLARVVLIFYREFRFPSWLSLPGALRASTDSRSQIFGSFDSTARFDSLSEKSAPRNICAGLSRSRGSTSGSVPITDFYFCFVHAAWSRVCERAGQIDHLTAVDIGFLA
jgi:hypothetical protein